MPLFECPRCGCIENTALGNYWTRPDGKSFHEPNCAPPACSVCGPAIFPDGTPNPNGGGWHGRFRRRSAIGMYIDGQGFLWGSKELSQIPAHIIVVGVVRDKPTPEDADIIRRCLNRFIGDIYKAGKLDDFTMAINRASQDYIERPRAAWIAGLRSAKEPAYV